MNNFWTSLRRPILALAPMEGINDTAYRQLCKQWGADVVYTEFLSADAIAHGAKKVLAKMTFDPSEQPVICQIFGKDPQAFVVAAKEVEKRGFAGLDINFGCPARKVVGHGSGVALLRDPQYARQLIEAALNTVSIPVSIKVRTSIRKERAEISPGTPDRYTAVDFIDAVRDLPIAAVMVHGRSFEQGHQGDIDADMIHQVKEHFPGLVLANGGIFTPERTISMLAATGADGVGLARGSWGQPWIFQQTRELLETGQFTPMEWSKITDVILQHAELLAATKGEHGLIEFRKYFAKYIAGRPHAAKFRAKAVRVSTLADVKKLVAELA